MLKLGEKEILLFKSVADVLAFDKKYKGKFFGSNGEKTIKLNGDDIINIAGVKNIGGQFQWVYNNSGRKEIYRKSLSYDL